MINFILALLVIIVSLVIFIAFYLVIKLRSIYFTTLDTLHFVKNNEFGEFENRFHVLETNFASISDNMENLKNTFNEFEMDLNNTNVLSLANQDNIEILKNNFIEFEIQMDYVTNKSTTNQNYITQLTNDIGNLENNINSSNYTLSQLNEKVTDLNVSAIDVDYRIRNNENINTSQTTQLQNHEERIVSLESVAVI